MSDDTVHGSGPPYVVDVAPVEALYRPVTHVWLEKRYPPVAAMGVHGWSGTTVLTLAPVHVDDAVKLTSVYVVADVQLTRYDDVSDVAVHPIDEDARLLAFVVHAGSA